MISVMYVHTRPAEIALVEYFFLLLPGQTTDALSKLLSLQPSDAVLLTYEDGNLVKYVIIGRAGASPPSRTAAHLVVQLRLFFYIFIYIYISVSYVVP